MCWVARADFPALKRAPAIASSSDWLIGQLASDTWILRHFIENFCAFLYEQDYDIRYVCKIPPRHEMPQLKGSNQTHYITAQEQELPSVEEIKCLFKPS